MIAGTIFLLIGLYLAWVLLNTRQLAKETKRLQSETIHRQHVAAHDLAEIKKVVNEILVALTPVGATRVEFYAVIDGKEQRIEQMFKKVDAPFRLKVSFKDAKGNDAKVDGAPVWSLSDESLADLAVDEGGMAALVSPKGPVGSFKVQCSADADLGEGVKSILGEAQIDLLPGDAVVVEISEE